MQLTNHIGEKFEIRILGKKITPNNETVNWWYKSSIVITEDGKKRKTNLRFLTREDLFLLTSWLENIEKGDFNKTRFEFVDAHVWFRLWKRGRVRFLRFFIQGDKYRKFYWDWKISTNNLILMKSYIITLKTI